MGITLTKKRYLLWTTLFAVVVSLGIWGIYAAFFPEYYFAWYPAIPVFFYLFSWYYIYMFDLYRKRASKKLLSVYMQYLAKIPGSLRVSPQASNA